MASRITTKEFKILVKTIGLKRAITEIQKVTEATNQSTLAQNKMHRTQVGVMQGTSNSTKAFAKQAQGLGGLVRVYASFAARMFALTAAFGALKRNADLKVLIEQTELLGIKTGMSFNTVAASLQEATAGALSYREALTSASLALNAGLSSDQVEELTEGATILAQTLGRDVAESVNRMIQAVVKGESELLDELGIVLRLDKAYSDYAKTLGKTTKDLSVYERQQATVLAVTSQVAAKTAGFEALENPYDRLAASLKNVADILLDLLGGPLGSFVTILADNLSVLIPIVTLAILKFADKTIFAFAQSGEAIAKTTEEFIRNSDVVVRHGKKITKTQGDIVRGYRAIAAASKIALTGGIAQQPVLLTEKLGDVTGSLKMATGGMQTFTNAIITMIGFIGRSISFLLKWVTRLSIWISIIALIGVGVKKVATMFGLFNDKGKEAIAITKKIAESQELLTKSYQDYIDSADKRNSSLTLTIDNASRLANIFEGHKEALKSSLKALDAYAYAGSWDVIFENIKNAFGGGIRPGARKALQRTLDELREAGESLSLSGTSDTGTVNINTLTSSPEEIKGFAGNIHNSAIEMQTKRALAAQTEMADKQMTYAESLKTSVTLLKEGKTILADLVSTTLKDSPVKKQADALDSLKNETLVLSKSLETLNPKQRVQALEDLKSLIDEIDPTLSKMANIELGGKVDKAGIESFLNSIIIAAEIQADKLSESINLNKQLETSKLRVLALNEKVSLGQVKAIRELAEAERDVLSINIRQNEAKQDLLRTGLRVAQDLSDPEKSALRAQITVLDRQNDLLKQQIDYNSDRRAYTVEQIALEKELLNVYKEELGAFEDRDDVLSAITGASFAPRDQQTAAAAELASNAQQESHLKILAIRSEILMKEFEIHKKGLEGAELTTANAQLERLRKQRVNEVNLAMIEQIKLQREAQDLLVRSNDFSEVSAGAQLGVAFQRESQKFSEAMDSHIQNVQKVVLNTFDAGIDDFTDALVRDGEFNIDAMKDALRDTLAEVTSDYLKQLLRQMLASLGPQTVAIQTQTGATVSLTTATWALYGAMSTAAATGGSSAGSSIAGIISAASMFSGAAGGTGTSTDLSLTSGMTNNNGINAMFPMASGGVVNQPTVALIGEGKTSEAVVPLPNNRSIPVEMKGGGTSVSISQSFDFRNADKQAVTLLRAEAKNIERNTIKTLMTQIDRGGQAARITGRRR